MHIILITAFDFHPICNNKKKMKPLEKCYSHPIFYGVILHDETEGRKTDFFIFLMPGHNLNCSPCCLLIHVY